MGGESGSVLTYEIRRSSIILAADFFCKGKSDEALLTEEPLDDEPTIKNSHSAD